MFRTALLTLFALSVSVTVCAQPAIGVMVGQQDYCGHRYVPKPAAGSFVFFDDQPLRMRLWLTLREASGEHRLRSVSSAQAAISATATFYALPAEPASGGTTKEVSLRMRGDIIRYDNDLETVVSWSDEMNLQLGVAYVLPVEVATRLSPGFYRLHVNFAGTDEKGEKVVPGVFDFEFRNAEQDSEPERIRRRACEALRNGSIEEAELQARRLLRLVPTSSEGYALLAEAAEKRSDDYRSRGDSGRALGFAEEAKRNYQRQLDMQLEDSLLLKHTPATLLREDAEGIGRKANGAQ